MPPADPAALSAAIATVRELDIEGQSLEIDDRYRLDSAEQLLAREFVRLLDAGQLVRNVPCTAVGPHHLDACVGGRVTAPNAQFTRDCTVCRGLGFVTEPLIAKEVGT